MTLNLRLILVEDLFKSLVKATMFISVERKIFNSKLFFIFEKIYEKFFKEELKKYNKK